MDARTYLRKPARIRADMDILNERIDELRKSMLPKAVSYDKDPVQTSPQDPMPNYAAKIDELNRELFKLLHELEDTKDDITNTLKKIDNDEVRSIMAQRYIGRKPWRVISQGLMMSEETMYRRHRLGLRIVEKIIS